MSMRHYSTPTRLAFAAITASGFVITVGCGDDTGLPARYPVTGTVTYNGKPIEKGQINFIAPAKSELRDANGFIENGKYFLTTAKQADGAIPGDYGVIVTAIEVDDTKIMDTVKKYGGGGRQSDIAKATAKGKLLVPAKYRLPETSGLKANVKPAPNKLDFDLKDE